MTHYQYQKNISYVTTTFTGVVLFGYYAASPWDNSINELVMRRKFRQHNADVIQVIPFYFKRK